MDESLEEFIRALPKVELHAHLNGSLSSKTLQTLRKFKYGKDAENMDEYRLINEFSLNEAFKKFEYAHDLTDSPQAVHLAAEGAIRDFAEDNVIYLELRTTPRTSPDMTKDQYLTAVIEAIIKCQITYSQIQVKLIISLSRKEDINSAQENLALILKYQKLYPQIVKGVDLSGDPLCGKFQDWRDILQVARDNGLKLALHCGEVNNEAEIAEMLEFGMNRLGHGTFVVGDNEKKLLRNNAITLECCLTSNYLCGLVANLEDHHFWRFFDAGHPVVICTDDFGVFSTNLSNELIIASKTFRLTRKDLIRLNDTAIACSFAEPAEKVVLLEKMNEYRKTAGIN